MTEQVDVLVAGATGALGSRIVSGLLDRGETVRALVRPGLTEGKARAVGALRDRGLQVVEGDITAPVTELAGALEGARTVVSAVQGGPDLVVDGQLNLLRAAERAGCSRFVPSDFAVDMAGLDDGDSVLLDWRRQAADAFAGTPLDVLSVLNGAFVEVMTGFMDLVDWAGRTVSHWGDADQPMDLTTMDDAAAYTVAALLDPALRGGTLRFAGEVVTMRRFHEAVERGTGQKFTLRRLGSADELRDEIDRRAARTANPFEYAALQYQWCMVTGKSKFSALDNDRYPWIGPVTVEEYVRGTRG